MQEDPVDRLEHLGRRPGVRIIGLRLGEERQDVEPAPPALVEEHPGDPGDDALGEGDRVGLDVEFAGPGRARDPVDFHVVEPRGVALAAGGVRLDDEPFRRDEERASLFLDPVHDRVRERMDDRRRGVELRDERHELVGAATCAVGRGLAGVDPHRVLGVAVADEGYGGERGGLHDPDLFHLQGIDEIVRDDGTDEPDGREPVDDERPLHVDSLDLVDPDLVRGHPHV